MGGGGVGGAVPEVGGTAFLGCPPPKSHTRSSIHPSPETIAAVFKSDLKIDFPFDLLETFFFAILG